MKLKFADSQYFFLGITMYLHVHDNGVVSIHGSPNDAQGNLNCMMSVCDGLAFEGHLDAKVGTVTLMSFLTAVTPAHSPEAELAYGVLEQVKDRMPMLGSKLLTVAPGVTETTLPPGVKALFRVWAEDPDNLVVKSSIKGQKARPPYLTRVK